MKLLSALFVTGALVSAPAFAEGPFTTEQLPTAAKAAADAFKAELGATLYNTIFGIQIQKASDGGKAKIFYKEAGATKTLEFFCHFHTADEIDCHEL